MKKMIKKVLLVFILIVSMLLGVIVFKGVNLYNKTMENVEISEVIFEKRKSENYICKEEISSDFLEIIVALEDHRFYEHSGFDVISFGRAIIRNVNQGEFAAGGSTITQQLAKNLFFSFEKKLERKVAEYLVAKELEVILEKDDILEVYVNVIYYGDHNIGILEASKAYFNVLPSELTLSQSVLLAGLPQAPSTYALSLHFDKAIVRSNKVLEVLIDKKVLTEDEVIVIKKEIIEMKENF